MAKSLGEINYEYLVEFFGSVEGHENFFTSDDGEEVLVFPTEARAAGRDGLADSTTAQVGRTEGPRRARPGARASGGPNAIARLLRGIVSFGRGLACRLKRDET
jgi:hypothetical protein